MAATAGPSCSEGQIDVIKSLYPAVNEDETPLPRSWSPKDKFHYIGLSQSNLRVHYKGLGKTHKDAASVRATHPIPASCGLYYFEVKIISKGRDGYMGIGLSAQGVNLNRLPGWDKHSFGYHGDDGHSFCSSGTGVKYGPTFTTSDTVGCCVNFIDSSVFYTLNGVNLGIAFSDLPPNLFPTVGLQTPGEVVEANFGASPFLFDIENYMREWKKKTTQAIERFPVEDRQGEWQSTLHKMVQTYLVHHGYCATAETFARSTGQSFEEELASIRNRQKIQRLVLAGRIGEAIELTQHLYPGLLDRNPNLMFMLKCRQFIEMVNGTDSEVRAAGGATGVRTSPRSQQHSASPSPAANMSPMQLISPMTASARGQGSSSSHILPPSSLQQQQSFAATTTKPPPPPHSSASSTSASSSASSSSSPSPSSSAMSTPTESSSTNVGTGNSASANNPQGGTGLNQEDVMNRVNSAINGAAGGGGDAGRDQEDVDMDTCDSVEDSRSSQNGVSNGVATNGAAGDVVDNGEQAMDTEEGAVGGRASTSSQRQLCGGSQPAMERMLAFGRKLQNEHGLFEHNRKPLHDAFSLLAYSDPWSSPVGFQLDPVQREPVCAALNSAILESHGLPKQPPLELAIGQANQCMKLMAKAGVGACAFASVTDYLH